MLHVPYSQGFHDTGRPRELGVPNNGEFGEMYLRRRTHISSNDTEECYSKIFTEMVNEIESVEYVINAMLVWLSLACDNKTEAYFLICDTCHLKSQALSVSSAKI